MRLELCGKVWFANIMQISIASSVTKHTPVYKLTVRYSDFNKSSSFDWKTLEISAPFTQWFSADGHFIAKPFQQWLASEIPMVAKADPSNMLKPIDEAKLETKAKSAIDYGTPTGMFAPPKPRRGKK